MRITCAQCVGRDTPKWVGCEVCFAPIEVVVTGECMAFISATQGIAEVWQRSDKSGG